LTDSEISPQNHAEKRSDVEQNYRQQEALLPRRDVSVKLSPNAAYSSVGTTCTTSLEQIEVMELEGYNRPTYNKLLHLATTRATIIGVIHEITSGHHYLNQNLFYFTINLEVALLLRQFLID